MKIFKKGQAVAASDLNELINEIEVNHALATVNANQAVNFKDCKPILRSSSAITIPQTISAGVGQTLTIRADIDASSGINPLNLWIGFNDAALDNIRTCSVMSYTSTQVVFVVNLNTTDNFTTGVFEYFVYERDKRGLSNNENINSVKNISYGKINFLGTTISPPSIDLGVDFTYSGKIGVDPIEAVVYGMVDDFSPWDEKMPESGFSIKWLINGTVYTQSTHIMKPVLKENKKYMTYSTLTLTYDQFMAASSIKFMCTHQGKTKEKELELTKYYKNE